MPYRDSVDKIVMVYLAAVAKGRFCYRGGTYSPRPIRVSPLVFRDYRCPERCGGCCPRFTLDYLPDETAPYDLVERFVEVDGRKVFIWTDYQDDSAAYHCRNLDQISGRCLIHGRHPFTCDFELLRFIHRKEKTHLNQQLFGRGWAMLRIDGARGARCSMAPLEESTIGEICRKLARLQRWAEHLGVDTWIPEIIDWVRSGPHVNHLDLAPEPND